MYFILLIDSALFKRLDDFIPDSSNDAQVYVYLIQIRS